MKVIVATAQVPFIKGGAELMTSGLKAALQEYGHDTEVVSLPFKFSPPDEIRRGMDAWESQDFSRFDCG